MVAFLDKIDKRGENKPRKHLDIIISRMILTQEYIVIGALGALHLLGRGSTVTVHLKSILRLILPAILLSSLVAGAAITGSISGTVSDSSGAVIPGVTVVVTSIATGVQNKTVTDGKGFYS